MATDDWQPIETAPSGVEILLAWTTGDTWRPYSEGYDWIWTRGELTNGEWLDGPWGQPNWWMANPHPPPDMR